ncbi:MAG TPA: GIY-YIG nuclease family protein [Nitrososphaerales archaeon]
MANWFVYIVRCRTGQLYTGITLNIKRRLEQHNKGIGSKFTRGRRPVKLVYREICKNRSSAAKRETTIKKMARMHKLSLIANKRI